MKRIGLLTVHCSLNFGAALQAYAIGSYLKERGNEVEILNYRFEGFLGILDRSYKKKLTLKQYIKKICFYKELYGRHIKFSDFEKEYMVSETEIIENKKDFEKIDGYYDVYIVGSDQVWNPLHINYDEIFFFDSINRGIKASFAASIGKGQLLDSERSFLADHLGNIDFISVREKSAQKLINGILPQTNVEIHADPVFLIDKENWRSLETIIKVPNNYAVIYLIGEYDKKLVREIILDLRSKHIYVYFLHERIIGGLGDKNLYNIGPREFLYLIDNANIVITNSFHGSAFSIIFEKTFVALISADKNERLKDLFIELGIENVQISTIEDYFGLSWKVNEENISASRISFINENKMKSNDYMKRLGV